MDIQIIQSLDQSVVEEQLQKRRAVANAASTNAATDTIQKIKYKSGYIQQCNHWQRKEAHNPQYNDAVP